MRRDYLMYGVIALALGALLLYVVPDGADTRANAVEGTDGMSWTDILGTIAALAGVALLLAGVFMDNRGRLDVPGR